MTSSRSISISILVLLGSGLFLRLLLAYVILPDSHVSGDVLMYTDWGQALAIEGPSGFYAKLDTVDYPPGYLYVLWAVGEISRMVAPGSPVEALGVAASLMRIPPIAFDVCAGFLLYLIVRRWAGSSPNAEHTALIAAAIYLFNPVTWYDSAIWGQTDSVGACLILISVIALTQWSSEAAAAIATLAALVKPQFGVVLIPLVGAVLLRRHLYFGSNLASDALFGRTYWLRNDGPVRLISSFVTAIIVFYVVLAPFDLDARSFIQRMTKTATFYNYLSVNAFSAWALIGSGNTPAIIFATPETFGEKISWSHDDIPILGIFTGADIGSFLLVLGFGLGVARLIWSADRWSIVLVGAYFSMCFFMLPTRVHERYLIPTFAFASLLAALDRKWLWATITLAVASFINIHGIFTMIDLVAKSRIHLPLSAFFRTQAGILLSIVLHTAVFCFAIWCLRPKLMQSEMHRQDVAVGMDR